MTAPPISVRHAASGRFSAGVMSVFSVLAALVVAALVIIDPAGAWHDPEVGPTFGFGAMCVILLCSAVAYACARGAANTGIALLINDAGLLAEGIDVGVIDWNDIVSVAKSYTSRSETIRLTLKDPKKYLARLPADKRPGPDDAVDPGFFKFSTIGLTLPADDILRHVRDRIPEHWPRMDEGAA
jgi:hypothetical protein